MLYASGTVFSVFQSICIFFQMLSTAEGSMRSTNETNGLLNNNTVDAIKLDEPIIGSADSVLQSLDETASQKLMAETEGIVPADSPLLLGDRCAGTPESSTKVTRTWCPPIQTATHISDINGKKVVKIPAKDDQAQTERKDSDAIRLAERVVRAPCVKLEPQEGSLSNSSKMANLLPLVACTDGGSLQFMKIKPEPPTSLAGESSNSDAQPNAETKEKITVTSNASIVQKIVAVTEAVGMTGSCTTHQQEPKPLNSNMATTTLPQVLPLPSIPTAAQATALASEITAAALSAKTELDLSKNIASSPSNQTRRPCNCTRSSCLKLYCECFAQGIACNGCNCTNCHNNSEYLDDRNRAIKLILDRNPCAFQSKIRKQYGHVKGCNCKKSNCLKNYCECYEVREF